MKIMHKMAVLTAAGTLMVAGLVSAQETPVHPITDTAPAVGEKGKVMLYGVIIEKAPESQRVNDPHDTRQSLERSGKAEQKSDSD
ncbi:hypothetical protein [Natronospira bacteriovora]|uniref:Secreted protein n=1 Tax=Natronospira bacteriovora TaxID=3069753 RepID=A0ABU0W4D4_9GAMM|nr:hypothetical protein [Natronospira sp. AB-CW4]MDQ2068889.1 hypothetical protein [Natronospira sp. AB-CW4]